MTANPSSSSPARVLRDVVSSGRTLVVPGAPNALPARLVEEAGFEAVYVTGAGLANTFFASPDVGLVSLAEVVAHVSAIRDAVDIPIIVDADTGYGNAVNVAHTVRRLERAGADAVQLEDQTFPKRCGHFAGKDVISEAEMVQKIKAAVDSRNDPDLLVVARTDARGVHGLTAACDRGNAYRAAGADVVFVEGPQSEDEITIVAKTVDAPKVLNLVEGGVTPHLPQWRIEELGFAIALYANLPLLAALRGMRDVLAHLRSGAEDGRPPVATWEERQALVRKPAFDEMERRYEVTTDD